MRVEEPYPRLVSELIDLTEVSARLFAMTAAANPIAKTQARSIEFNGLLRPKVNVEAIAGCRRFASAASTGRVFLSTGKAVGYTSSTGPAGVPAIKTAKAIGTRRFLPGNHL